jgi:arylsulfatase A-like enzyme
MADQAQAGRPFFLQISHYAVHTPVRGRAGTVEEFRGLPRGTRHDDPVHAAMIADLDAGVGLVLEAIDGLGLRDTTYVVFTSDNGSYIDEDGVPVTSNLPLAGQKTMVLEGGIRVPLIVRGPDIAAGAVSSVPVAGQDLFATIADWLDIAPLPAGVEGGSLAPLLAGASPGVVRPREDLVWHFPHYSHRGATPQSALLRDGYKLIHDHETGADRLFRLADDIGESRDLSAQDPARAESLRRDLFTYLESVEAQLPLPNPAFSP